MPHYVEMSIDHDAIRERIRSTIDMRDELSMRSVSMAGIGSDSALHKFLTGDTKTIRLENIAKVADAMGVTLAWLLFGRELAPDEKLPDDLPLNEVALEEMVANALEEIQPGMTLGEIRPAVASSLHEQLRLHLTGGAVVDFWAERSARDKGAQSQSPTRRGAPGASRTG